jgi:hypothetical protein
MNLGCENAQIAGMGLVKISLLLYYRRIFVSKGFIIASNILIGVTSCFTIAVILVSAQFFDKLNLISWLDFPGHVLFKVAST